MRPYIEDEDSGAGARLGLIYIYIYQRQLAAEAKKSQAHQTIPQDPEFSDGILLLKPLFVYPSLKFAVRDSFLSKAGTRIHSIPGVVSLNSEQIRQLVIRFPF